MSFKTVLRTCFKAAKRAAHWLSEVLTPQATTKRWLLVPAVMLLGLAGAYLNVVAQSGAGFWVDALTGAILAILLGLVVALLLLVTRWLLQRAGRHLGVLPVAAVLTAAWLLHIIGSKLGYLVALTVFVGSYLVVTGVLLLIKRQRLIAATAAVLLGAWLSLGMLSWLIIEQPGSSPVAELMVAFSGGDEHQHLLVRGDYPVEHFTYGSGNDKRRAEYAAGARFTTESVDGSDFLESWSGWRGKMRTRTWGFGADELPLNAQVWHPSFEQVGEALPLVVIVHGNSNMFNRSELGYAWLGEHLASRGHVVVSVDQNFLNGGGPLYNGLYPENDARGWLLLEHLKQWQSWTEDTGHPLSGKVDMNNITLMGHSRGGEAVYLAGVFNQLPHYPDNALIEFDYNFGITGVVAIAPIDGQFRPSGKRPVLQNTNFFTIHGGHDSDASFFHGDRQYHRAQPDYSNNQFKASVYIHHANHGQFNTQWGNRDYAGLYGRALNTSVLLSGEQQRQAAKAYFTAFVEQGADPVFCAPEQLGTVLPVDIFVARCQLSERYVLADFEQGMDVTNGNTDGVHMKAQSLPLWKEAKLPFRQGHRERAGVWLGWNAEAEDATESFYLLELPPGVSALQALNQQSVLHLELAQLDQDPPEYENVSDGLRESADFMIVLEDRSGNSAQVRLSEVGGIAPPLPAAHIRDEAVLGLAKLQSLFSDFFASHKTTEAVIQSVQIPLELFSTAGVQLDDLSSVRLHFDQGASVIIIDEISVR